MTIAEALQLMRDPLGAPMHPVIFQALLIITWVLHIFFVTLAVGASTTAIWGFMNKGEYPVRLARLAARLTPNAVGLGVVMGIAPLLFVQVIYDPMWYVANTLTGFWSALFIFIVIGGYSLAYLFYLKGSQDGKLLWSAVTSLLLLLLAGWVMHALTSVSIRPDKWLDWYAPGGVINTTGTAFHSYNIPRLLFLLPLQAALSFSALLLLFTWYFQRRPDTEPAFLQWVGAVGRQVGLYVSPLYALTGLLWGLTEGSQFGVGLPVAGILTVLGLGLTYYYWQMKNPVSEGIRAMSLWAAGLAMVAVIREWVRLASLAQFNYNVYQYPYTWDWGSIVFFAVSAVAGLAVVSYLIMLLYQSGAGQPGGEVNANAERMGRISVGLMGGWFAFFLILGAFISFR